MSDFVILHKNNYERDYKSLDNYLIKKIKDHIEFFFEKNSVNEYKKKILDLLQHNFEHIMDNSIHININQIKALESWFKGDQNPLKKDFITEAFFKDLINELYNNNNTGAINHISFTLTGKKNDYLMEQILKLINISPKIYNRSSTHFAGDGIPPEGIMNYLWNKVGSGVFNKRKSTDNAKGIDFNSTYSIETFEINTLLIQELLNKDLDENISIFLKPERNGTNSLTGLIFHTVDLMVGEKNMSEENISKKESCLNKELNNILTNILKDNVELKKMFKELSNEYFKKGERDKNSLLGMFIKNIIFSVLTFNQISITRSYCIYNNEKGNEKISKSLPKNFKKHLEINDSEVGIKETKENDCYLKKTEEKNKKEEMLFKLDL